LFRSCDGHEGPDEHPGIPAVLAAVHVLQCFVKIGLLDKLLRAIKRGFVRLYTGRRRKCITYPNIAVAGRWLSRLDTDGDNGLAAAGQIERVREHLLELFLLGNYM